MGLSRFEPLGPDPQGLIMHTPDGCPQRPAAPKWPPDTSPPRRRENRSPVRRIPSR